MAKINIPIVWFFALFISFVTAQGADAISGANEEPYSVSKPWTYPLRPGVPEWNFVESSIKALQIPTNAVNKMSTRHLAVSCLNYPMFGDIYFSDTFEIGFDFILTNTYAFQALLMRPDVGEILIERYLQFNVEAMRTNAIPTTSTDNFISFAFITQIIKRDEVLSKLDRQQAARLAKKSLSNLKKIHSDYGDTASNIHATSLLAKLLVKNAVIIPINHTSQLNSSKLSSLARGETFALSEMVPLIIQKYNDSE